ncbi:succinyl-diaminopimelate desuccinylase [Candidatus Magnetaquicoccus inordinatus]|uniref:succinyl-diaminopimelate desuccinylase n=1 Tax=Candidatus Magnetaquicoccus inordinatus TaxID=2496818 RepID=UPI00102C1C49|nr:succinyl-diaminopimelate desuccinylase [Candidatus Magnetaquicoccus inordinatus]
MDPSASPLELAVALLRIPSITPRDEGCQLLIGSFLQQLGFTLYPLRFGNVDNLYARLGSKGKNFCFAGHTDVVTPGEESRWQTPPFAAAIVDGMLIGRGANDMKGGVAAMLAATARFLQANPNFAQHNSLSFLITGDEEGAAVDGTVKVLEWLRQRQESIDYCLVGEPTCMQQLGDGLKQGRRGSLNAELIFQGRQGHVAYPHLADNPIHRAAPLLDRLARHRFDEGNAHFPPTTLQMTRIQAGDGSDNVIPGSLRLNFNFRFGTASTPAQLEEQIHNILAEADPPLPYTLTTHLSGRPFLTEGGELLQALSNSIRTVLDISANPNTAGGTSDARFISLDCPQTVEFGLFSPTIHQVNERVPVDELERLCQVYTHLLLTLFPAL